MICQNDIILNNSGIGCRWVSIWLSGEVTSPLVCPQNTFRVYSFLLSLSVTRTKCYSILRFLRNTYINLVRFIRII